MSHHGTMPFEEGGNEGIRKLLDEMKKASADYRGPVGAYPHGMLHKTDEGSLQFAVGAKDGKVVVDFGSPVAWFGLTPQQAMDLAGIIMQRAREAAAANGETVHLTIGR